nr:F-box protein At5g07610-like isoform X2 [Coffea arabica]
MNISQLIFYFVCPQNPFFASSLFPNNGNQSFPTPLSAVSTRGVAPLPLPPAPLPGCFCFRFVFPVFSISLRSARRRGVSWNGDLHWIGPWNYSACFDVSNERLRPLRYTIRTPEFEEHGDDWYFGESGGHLFYIHPNEPYGTLLDFFELESERDCLRWNVKYHVDLTPLTTLYPQMIKEEYDPTFDEPCAFYIIGFLVDDKEKKATLVISLADKIISCDFNNLTLMELADVEVDTNYGFPDNDVYRWDFAFQHVETLACL